MKSGMKQVQVPPFELILRQDVATAPIHPLECLPAPKTANKSAKNEKKGPRTLFALSRAAALWGAPPVQFTLVLVGL